MPQPTKHISMKSRARCTCVTRRSTNTCFVLRYTNLRAKPAILTTVVNWPKPFLCEEAIEKYLLCSEVYILDDKTSKAYLSYESTEAIPVSRYNRDIPVMNWGIHTWRWNQQGLTLLWMERSDSCISRQSRNTCHVLRYTYVTIKATRLNSITNRAKRFLFLETIEKCLLCTEVHILNDKTSKV